jgi:magnesium chelatase subunit I
LSNAEKRAVRVHEPEIVPRITDLHAIYSSTAGKIEIEYAAEESSETEIVSRLLDRALLAIFDRHLKVDELVPIVEYFEAGWGAEVGDQIKSEEYLEGVGAIPGLRDAVHRLGPIESPGFIAAASEFIFEGLHLHQKLNRDRRGSRWSYKA